MSQNVMGKETYILNFNICKDAGGTNSELKYKE